MNMKVENEMTLPTTKSVMVMLLEPYAGKLARTVLRGESSRKGADLLDLSYHSSFALRKSRLSLISHNLAYLKTTSKRALGIKISYSLLESMQRKYASMVISSICFVKQLPFSVSCPYLPQISTNVRVVF